MLVNGNEKQIDMISSTYKIFVLTLTLFSHFDSVHMLPELSLSAVSRIHVNP